MASFETPIETTPSVDTPPLATQDSNNLSWLDEDDFEDYGKSKIRIDKLISDFDNQVKKTVYNRENRYKNVNIRDLRNKGILKEYEYLIPMRTIDANIKREQPSFVNYLKQSRRLAIFKCISNPEFITTDIEEEFTRGMSYPGWEVPQFKVVDGAQTHGWDAIEVVFDTTKPLDVALEHIGHDRLIFPLDAQNIQACELIIRVYCVTLSQLKNFVRKFNFNPNQIRTLVEKNSTEMAKEKTVEIHKCFWRKADGVVSFAYYNKNCSDWLKAPAKLFMGRTQMLVEEPTPQGINPETGEVIFNQPGETTVDVDESLYPVFLLPYSSTEQPKISDQKGRVFLDLHKQEALTANISQFLNAHQIASSLFPSLKTEALRQSEVQSIKIKAGVVPSVPIEYHSPPPPDSGMLNLQQYLDVYNSQEAGQLNFAVQNRKDSRKTATEISAAKEESSKLDSVQLTLYSTFLRQLWNYVWGIVQNRATNGHITFLFKDELGGNDVERISLNYDIRAAGDIDVVKRSELIMQYKEFWPIIMNTPAAMPFLTRLVRLVFADEGDTFATLIEQGDPRAVIAQLVHVIEDPAISACIMENAKGLPAMQKGILINLLEQARTIAEGFMEEQAQRNPQVRAMMDQKQAEQEAASEEGGQEGGGENKQLENKEVKSY